MGGNGWEKTFNFIVLILCRRDFKRVSLYFSQSTQQPIQTDVGTLSSVRSLHCLRAGTDFRAFWIFSTCEKKVSIMTKNCLPTSVNIRMSSMQTHLFPVGGDYANVFSREFGETLLSLRFQQLGEVVDQNFDLWHVEERRTVGLSLVFAYHPVEDQWETLQWCESEQLSTVSPWFTGSLVICVICLHNVPLSFCC